MEAIFLRDNQCAFYRFQYNLWVILLWVILRRDCCRFLVQPFFVATVSPRCFLLLFFSLLLPPLHRVKAEQYKELVFSLSPSLIILDSNIISKVIAAFCCTWMKNSTYMGPQIKYGAEKLQHFFWCVWLKNAARGLWDLCI